MNPRRIARIAQGARGTGVIATINELTTVASAWTAAQFLNGTVLSGSALGLRIAAGNPRNFVDLETGGLGTVIQGPLNSSQTATLATFNTLANLLAGCACHPLRRKRHCRVLRVGKAGPHAARRTSARAVTKKPKGKGS